MPISAYSTTEVMCKTQEELRLERSRLLQIRFFLCCHRKRTKSLHPTRELCYVTGEIKGLYILSLNGDLQSTSLTVSNLDACELLPQHVGFALLEEAKELTETLRKILSALIFSAPNFIGPWRKGRHAQVNGNWDLRSLVPFRAVNSSMKFDSDKHFPASNLAALTFKMGIISVPLSVPCARIYNYMVMVLFYLCI